jgi:hypothetical protein
MGGLYDILESYRQQNDPRFVYEGLYEQPAYTGPNIDPMYNLGARQFGNMQRMDFGVPQQAEGIMQQAPLQNLGIDTSYGVANEEDTEQVDFLGTKPNRAQEGIAKLFEFLQRFSPVANIARGVESLRNRFDTNRAIRADVDRDTQGTINTITSPRIMNIKPTAQDTARGSMPTRTTSAPKRSFSSNYSAAQRARKF